MRKRNECVLVVPTPCALELVKDAVILIQIAQLPAQVIVDRDGLEGLRLHVDVPDLERQVVTRENVPPVTTEFHVRDG